MLQRNLLLLSPEKTLLFDHRVANSTFLWSNDTHLPDYTSHPTRLQTSGKICPSLCDNLMFCTLFLMCNFGHLHVDDDNCSVWEQLQIRLQLHPKRHSYTCPSMVSSHREQLAIQPRFPLRVIKSNALKWEIIFMFCTANLEVDGNTTWYNFDFTFLKGPFKMNIKSRKWKSIESNYTRLILYYIKNVT
jgi:hypothetical protein